MREAISLDDFRRKEKGLPPLKKKKIERSEPKPPTVEGQISYEDIPTDPIFEFSARACTFKNEEKVRFTGYQVFLESRAGKVVEGWMPEGQFQKLKQRIQGERPDLLQKIGL